MGGDEDVEADAGAGAGADAGGEDGGCGGATTTRIDRAAAWARCRAVSPVLPPAIT
ncbi:hypothetical protein BG846_01385 [Streptomyces fradiae ATCC 10745 = DSM 40063]|uniref:Uncharacterized protein n=1 Tax=Streptomyces fradiae ATCC 10745 = DSM 40063 TaxID=1319510 RepID=A0A1Y2NZL2_STRFR|nr:hypothetical protein BG846_01385 [Streptomyces fradiae ATCC 10745 = DSM 40063]